VNIVPAIAVPGTPSSTGEPQSETTLPPVAVLPSDCLLRLVCVNMSAAKCPRTER